MFKIPFNDGLIEGLLDWCEANDFEGCQLGRGKSISRKVLMQQLSNSEPRVIIIEDAKELIEPKGGFKAVELTLTPSKLLGEFLEATGEEEFYYKGFTDKV